MVPQQLVVVEPQRAEGEVQSGPPQQEQVRWVPPQLPLVEEGEVIQQIFRFQPEVLVVAEVRPQFRKPQLQSSEQPED